MVKPVNKNNIPFREEDGEILTKEVFFLGNGKSRLKFNLEGIKQYGTVIGCNALYRDFSPDILLAIDSKMINEINRSDYGNDGDKIIIIPANRSANMKKARKYRCDRFNTCGAFGMRLIGMIMKPKTCYMIGMDGYPGNVYDGTENYAQNTLQNFSGVTNHYQKNIEKFKEINFVNVNDKDEWPNGCNNLDNYSFMHIKEFKEKFKGT